MAFSSLILTDTGTGMVADAITEGTKLTFTCVRTSSHTYDGSECSTLSALSDVQQEAQIDDMESGDSCIKVAATFDNTDVASAYMLRAYGLYAKLGSGKEKLFGISIDPTPMTIPAETDGPVLTVTLASTVLISNTDVVQIVTDPTAWATRRQFERLKASHVRIPAFGISVSDWDDLQYRVEDSSIREDSICEVFFSNACRTLAADAGITGDTTDGALVLTCTDTPAGTVYIDLIEVRNEVE